MKHRFTTSKARFYIYRNIKTINTTNTCSIKYKESVVEHSSYLLCEDVNLIVRKSGSAKAKVERIRNVHAFIAPMQYSTFDKEEFNTQFELTKLRRITYNPFNDESFVYVDNGNPVLHTERVLISEGKVYDYPPQ